MSFCLVIGAPSALLEGWPRAEERHFSVLLTRAKERSIGAWPRMSDAAAAFRRPIGRRWFVDGQFVFDHEYQCVSWRISVESGDSSSSNSLFSSLVGPRIQAARSSVRESKRSSFRSTKNRATEFVLALQSRRSARRRTKVRTKKNERSGVEPAHSTLEDL